MIDFGIAAVISTAAVLCVWLCCRMGINCDPNVLRYKEAELKSKNEALRLENENLRLLTSPRKED